MKRFIFTLLYSNGYFMLSRNFRLQKVGDLNWLFKNYDLSNLTNFIDELIILNTSKKPINKNFLDTLNIISKKTFIPIVAGGSISKLSDVNLLLDAGADKIIINNLFFENPDVCKIISEKYGRQFLMGSIDFILNKKKVEIYNSKKGVFLDKNFNNWIDFLIKNGAGEILLQSMDNDGTGFGLEKKIFKYFNKKTLPIIIMGGVGNYSHIVNGYKIKNCDAVSTANLFNFIGKEFINVRKKLEKKYKLPKKNRQSIKNFKNILAYENK